MVRLSATVHDALRVEAAEEDLSVSATARSMIVAELVRRNPELLAQLRSDDVEGDGRES